MAFLPRQLHPATTPRNPVTPRDKPCQNLNAIPNLLKSHKQTPCPIVGHPATGAPARSPVPPATDPRYRPASHLQPGPR